MADFPDNLRPGSFRGVAFHVDGHSLDGGRRTQVFEFPQRNEAEAEDLGGLAKALKIDALVLGDDYMAARDALIAALDTEGPGELIHPFIGRKWVVAQPYGLSESTREGGVARFSLVFIEVAERAANVEGTDLNAAAKAAATDLGDQAQLSFADGFTVDAQPGWVVGEASAMVSRAQDAIDGLAAKVTGYGDKFNAFVAQGQALRSSVLTLAATPLKLAATVTAIVQGLRGLARTPAEALGLLRSLTSFGTGFAAVPSFTPSRAVQATNQAAVVDLVRRAAAAEAVQAAAEAEFASLTEAEAARDDLADVLADLAAQAADAGQDETWRSIATARAAMIRDVSVRAADLARLYSYTPAETLPAIVIAYSLYGGDDLEAREADMIARNDLRHPGFVTGGQPIEVLSDV